MDKSTEKIILPATQKSPNLATDGYPFAPRKSYPPEYIRKYLHLRARTKKFASVLRVRDAATKAVHDYFNSEGYFNIHTPILTSNDCEGAGEVFSVRPENKSLLKDMIKDGVSEDEAYFDSKIYLTVSGQLHLEAMAHGLEKVYTFGPTFRAENSKSRLHLSEFYMIEAETAFISELGDVMTVIEKLVKYVTESVANKCADDIVCVSESANVNLSWLNKPFVTLTYDEALSILDKNLNKLSSGVNKEEGLAKEHEIFLVNHCGNVPTFVINWPKQIKPFYMKQCSDDASKVAALDLLAPNVGEIAGGSLRENEYNFLKNKLPCRNSELDWYLELRKFGSVPTGGFGMGFERYLQLILQMNNIKDTIPFPRWPHNCSL
ncbi:Asparaginyl-tRNA synthetase mitochondrial [Carabus blaptoides fortunei]